MGIDWGNLLAKLGDATGVTSFGKAIQDNSGSGGAGEAGEEVGKALTGIAELFGDFAPTIGEFFSGIARGAGLENAGLLQWGGIGLGALLLLGGIKNLLSGSFITAVIEGFLGIALIGYIVSGI